MTASSGAPTAADRNVVLIVLDSVRKDYFDRVASRLGERADATFDACRAASSWSTPSHASMFTGELPHRHGIHTYQRSFDDLSPEETFLETLLARGYETAGVTANFYAGSAFGFDGLFDEFVDVDPDLRYPGSWGHLEADGAAAYAEFLRRALGSGAPLEYLANGVSTLLRGRFEGLPVPSPYDGGAVPTCRAVRRRVAEATEPFFLFVNFMDVHQPLFPHVGLDFSLKVPSTWSSKEEFYRVKWDINARDEVERHREFLANYRALYEATVAYLDRRVDELIDAVDRRTDRETTYIVTADHGENLGFEADGRAFEHTGTLTEATLHVPLSIVNAPAGFPDRVTDYVSHLRLGDLVTGVARGGVPDLTQRRIPAETLGLSPGTSSLRETERAELDRTMRAVYEGPRKVVWDSAGRVDEYRLDPERPSWQTRVTTQATVPEWAAQFFDDIEESRAAALDARTQTQDGLDAAAIDRLEDLGYR